MENGFDRYDEAAFKKWFLTWAQRTGVRLNADDPLNKYNFRKAWKDRANPIWNEELKKWEWQPQYKVEELEREIKLTITLNVQQGQEKEVEVNSDVVSTG